MTPAQDDLHCPAQAVGSRALIAHLRGDLHLLGRLAHVPGLGDRVRQRLLAVDVLAHVHRHQAGRRVRVVRRADGDGVDLLAHLVEHLAVVEVRFRVVLSLPRPRLDLFGVAQVFQGVVEMVLVDVADGDNVAEFAGLGNVAVALAADADAGNADGFIGGPADARRQAGQREEAGAGDCRLLQECTPRVISTHDGPSGSKCSERVGGNNVGQCNPAAWGRQRFSTAEQRNQQLTPESGPRWARPDRHPPAAGTSRRHAPAAGAGRLPPAASPAVLPPWPRGDG